MEVLHQHVRQKAVCVCMPGQPLSGDGRLPADRRGAGGPTRRAPDRPVVNIFREGAEARAQQQHCRPRPGLLQLPQLAEYQGA